MKIIYKVIRLSIFISFISYNSFCFAKNITNGIEYISPVPGSSLNNIHTSVIFRLSDSPVDIQSIKLNISGTSHTNYDYTLKLADDNRTVIIKPAGPFAYSEHIIINIPPIQLVTDKSTSAYILDFYIQSGTSNPIHEKLPFDGELRNEDLFHLNTRNNFPPLPADFPPVSVTVNNNPSPGGIFLSNLVIGNSGNYGDYLMILNNNGYPYYYKKLDGYGADFKMLDNGNMVYYKLNGDFYEMDDNFNLIDSFRTENGYSTDIHDFRMLPDGSYYIMSYDAESVDMSTIVTGGVQHASVTGAIIQKFDAHKNLVFQWRTWDTFNITDATHENLRTTVIDYAHVNAIEPLPDGNILVSSRHMDEITKIDTQTGEIIWRMGGINNQFTFINDDIRFSHQHAIRMLPNGNITLFDNGNFHTPHFSRACEYKLDEKNKTVELVWQYRNTPDNYGFALGYVQRLSNGNTLISWGASNPNVTEVKPDGTKVLELSLPQGMYSYRAYKFDWNRYVSTSEPVDYALSQNFPNPFNPSTKIRFDMPSPGPAKLFVTDMLGREVTVLVNEELNVGTYEYTFNSAGLSSGVYFYSLTAGGRVQTKKMMVLK
ncbi:hypothetical protein BH10BAC5_BH10BAC5_23410 [soil metagenome]